jgi:hypothetical protein
METDAFTALQYFNIQSIDSPADEFIPPLIQTASLSDKRLWLYTGTQRQF